MKNFKGFAMGLVLGLGLALSTIGFAQNATQADQKKNNKSCCAMASCCCKGDSCPMNHQTKDYANKDDMKTPSSGSGCCCCGADSCDMRMHDMQEKPKGN